MLAAQRRLFYRLATRTQRRQRRQQRHCRSVSNKEVHTTRTLALVIYEHKITTHNFVNRIITFNVLCERCTPPHLLFVQPCSACFTALRHANATMIPAHTTRIHELTHIYMHIHFISRVSTCTPRCVTNTHIHFAAI